MPLEENNIKNGKYYKLNMSKYPTDWAHGKAMGSIDKNKRTYVLLRFSNQKSISYPISNFKSRKECIKFVEEEKIKKSHELGLTKNEVRFLDKNTIEVNLSQGKTFITDAKNLEIVNAYSLHAKSKKEKNAMIRWYVIAQIKKTPYQFTNFITNYKIVEYVNNNTLDLREINMKEFGLDYKVKNNIREINDIDIIEDQYKYYLMSINELPFNEWILGNLVYGTIFSRKNQNDKLIMRIKDIDGDKLQKTFLIKDYESPEEANLEARKYMINVSHHLGTVKNKIRIVNNEIIEIMIDEDNIMITDYVFLPLFIPSNETFKTNITISTTHASGSEKMYATAHSIYFQNKKKQMTFHKFIMGAPMIDHINGNTLDNRLENLRYTNYSHNNTNRMTMVGKNTVTGVCFNKKNKHYQASIKDNGTMFFKIFSVREYGKKAKKLATQFRKQILEINFLMEDKFSDIKFTKNDIKVIENAIKRTKEHQNLCLNNLVVSPEKYLFGFDKIDPKLKNKMYLKYACLQAIRYTHLNIRINKLQELLEQIKKLPEKKPKPPKYKSKKQKIIKSTKKHKKKKKQVNNNKIIQV